MADNLERMPARTRLMILGPVIRGRKGEYHTLLEDLAKQGFARVRVDGQLYEMTEKVPLERYKKHDIEVVVDRVVIGPDQRTRLVDSLETAAKLGQGSVVIVPVDGGEEIQMSQDYACPYDGVSVPEPEPRNFSFNTPHGACPTCTGLGTQLIADADLVIPDSDLSLSQGAIAPWSRSQFFYPEMLETVCEAFGIDMKKAIDKLAEKERDALLNGTGSKKIRFTYRNQYRVKRWYEAPFEGVLANIQRRYRETESEFLKQELEKYMSEKPCPTCQGSRLKPESLAVTVAGHSISEVCRLCITDAIELFERLPLSERESIIARGILKEIRERLQFMVDVGLEYLTLERTATTLSGGAVAADPSGDPDRVQADGRSLHP